MSIDLKHGRTKAEYAFDKLRESMNRYASGNAKAEDIDIIAAFGHTAGIEKDSVIDMALAVNDAYKSPEDTENII